MDHNTRAVNNRDAIVQSPPFLTTAELEPRLTRRPSPRMLGVALAKSRRAGGEIVLREGGAHGAKKS
jgi:hypothetical protein